MFSRSNKILELQYGNQTVGELVNKDTDGDGVLDWEESLRGTDPTKIDSDNDGIGDKEELATTSTSKNSEGNFVLEEEENLTQTDKLSRELFTTAASLSQAGEVTQKSAEEIAQLVSEKVNDTTPERIFLASEIKTINDNSASAMQKYITDLNNIYAKYPPPEKTVLDILYEFTEEQSEDTSEALSQLTPIAEQTASVLKEMLLMSVPSELAKTHLDMMNALERLRENISNIQLFETDSIVAIGAVNQYEQNTADLESIVTELGNLINARLGN